MRQWWCVFVPAVLPLLAGAAPALATVGGPTVVKVLGLDPATQCVYVHSVTEDGGDGFGRVFYFALDASNPEKAVSTALVGRGEGSVDDTTLVRGLAALRRTLIPLPGSIPELSLPWTSAVATDTLRDEARALGPIARHRVRARWTVTPGEFEFIAYDQPGVVLRSVHALPGRSAQLLVFAFVGDPFEGGYETQVAMLIARPADLRREVR
jgi:hypothetical protein